LAKGPLKAALSPTERKEGKWEEGEEVREEGGRRSQGKMGLKENEPLREASQGEIFPVWRRGDM